MPTLISFASITNNLLIATETIEVTVAFTNQLLTTLYRDSFCSDVFSCYKLSFIRGTILNNCIEILSCLCFVTKIKSTLGCCQIYLRKTHHRYVRATWITIYCWNFVQPNFVVAINFLVFWIQRCQEYVITNILWI